jgi:hypothetical protein
MLPLGFPGKPTASVEFRRVSDRPSGRPALDAPFLAVEMTVAHQRADQVLRFLTNVGDWVEVGAGHPNRFEKAAFDGIKPYIHARGGLWALVTRGLVLDLVELGEIGEHDGARCFGVVSAVCFFPIANADEVESGDINPFINMRTCKPRFTEGFWEKEIIFPGLFCSRRRLFHPRKASFAAPASERLLTAERYQR